MTLVYRGINRNGTHVVGSHTGDCEPFVRSKFDQRWRSLEVYPATDCDVDPIGQIYRDDSGRRVWWVDVSHNNQGAGDD